jgi:putative ABC transport system permease protein
MLVYLRLLKESFAFAMDALRSNMLRTFAWRDYRNFSIIAVLAAVDSLDRKISKDLSGLYYLFNEILFGPSEIPKWKREQFPILSMMNTPT